MKCFKQFRYNRTALEEHNNVNGFRELNDRLIDLLKTYKILRFCIQVPSLEKASIEFRYQTENDDGSFSEIAEPAIIELGATNIYALDFQSGSLAPSQIYLSECNQFIVDIMYEGANEI